MRCVPTVLLLGMLLIGSTASCGGGTRVGMRVVALQFLNRDLSPVVPLDTQSLPCNAIVAIAFSEPVDPASISDQTVKVRLAATQTVPPGSLSVIGNQVLFDPTVTGGGEPNPLGFEPVTEYVLDIPGVGEQDSVVENLDADPNLVTFFTQFTTAAGWLRELVPPEVEDVVWIPAEDPTTKEIPGNGIMGIQFSEPMNPITFVPGLDVLGPTPDTTVDVRYTLDAINQTGPVDGQPIHGSFTPSADYQTFFFRPMFSFGDKKFIFTVQIFDGVTDLSGNLLANPRTFGPFICDGKGIATGLVITEDFTTTTNMDPLGTDGDWGLSEVGVLQGHPGSLRTGQSLFFAAPFGDNTDYLLPVLRPNAQSGGASIFVEYQGADAVEADRRTINQAAPFTGWVQDINDCDGMQNIRFCIWLISNPLCTEVARVENIAIPMID